MGFQKKNISSRSEKVDFFESCGFLRQCLLKRNNSSLTDDINALGERVVLIEKENKDFCACAYP